MSCLGVHFALTEEQVSALKSLPEPQRLDFLSEELESHFFEEAPEYKAESDKAWDAIHRALTDGEIAYDNGQYPLSHFILGGEILYTADDYIMSLKTPEQVKDVAKAVSPLTKEEFRRHYFKIDPKSYGVEVNEEDFEYSWNWFTEVRELWQRAAEAGRYVLFTADQ